MKKKFKKTITKSSKKVYSFTDKYIVTPISKAVYIIGNKISKGNKLEKILNRPNVLVYVSLALAVIVFFFIDSQALNIAQTSAEIIEPNEINVLYNTSAYVVEGLPEEIDIVLTGKKSELYLANRLGDHIVNIDLTDYEVSSEPQKVELTYNAPIDSIEYKLVPSYVMVTIKEKVSDVKSISYDLLNPDKLDETLSVKSVELTKSEVVIKGSEETLEAVASVKALIDLSNDNFTEEGTFTIDNVNLVAYDASGEIMNNVEIIANDISAKLVLDSYSKTVPIQILTTGELVTGKAISSIKINDESNYEITIYGDSATIDSIESVPLTIDVTDQGVSDSKRYNLTITKPSGVRHMSETSATIVLEFGEAVQKTVEGVSVEMINVPSGLSVNAQSINDQEVDVQVIGIKSVLDTIDTNDIDAYIDLSGYEPGDHTVTVLVEINDPRVQYIVTKTINITIKD